MKKKQFYKIDQELDNHENPETYNNGNPILNAVKHTFEIFVPDGYCDQVIATGHLLLCDFVSLAERTQV